MKRTVLSVLALGVPALVACGGGAQQQAPATQSTAPVATTTPSATMTAAASSTPPAAQADATNNMDKMNATLKAMGAAYAKRDPAAIAALYSPDVVITIPGLPSMNGRDAITKMSQMGFGAFSDMSGTPTRLFEGQNVAAIELVITGTNDGSLMGKPATNRKIGLKALIVDWFNADGLIKEEHRYMDAMTEMNQLDPKADAKTFRPVMSAPPPGMPEVHVAKGTPDEATLGQAVAPFYASMSNKKEADFLGWITDTTTWDDYTAPMTMTGKDASKQFFEMFTKAFPDMQFAMSPILIADNFVLTEGTLTGTQNGDLPGIPATKKQATLHGLDILQVNADGKTLAHGWGFGNNYELLTQLGVIPAMGAGQH
jgi:predicted ester cyclase